MSRKGGLGIIIALALASQASAQQGQHCATCEPAEVRAEFRRTLSEELQRVRSEIDRVRAARRAQSDPDGVVARALREVEDNFRMSESHLRSMLSEASDSSMTAEHRMQPTRGSRATQESNARGYLGVSLSGTVRAQRTREGRKQVYTDYPVLVSVEPGSPAAKAGLLAGDVLLAYDGEDVRNRVIALGKLQPGRELPVRVRRGDGVKDVLVRVEPRPRGFIRVWPDLTVEFNGAPEPPAPPRPGAAPRVRQAPRPLPAREAEPAVTAPGAPMLMVMGPLDGMLDTSPIAGAEITRMTADLREVFNVDRGVLVLNVATGTQAERAGLRGGDVITAVDDKPVSSPIDLRRAVQRAEKSEVKLEVVRKQRNRQIKRTLTLEW